jgi:hypothetical protein
MSVTLASNPISCAVHPTPPEHPVLSRYIGIIFREYCIPPDTVAAFRTSMEYILKTGQIDVKQVNQAAFAELELSVFTLVSLFRDSATFDAEHVASQAKITSQALVGAVERYMFVWIESYCNALYRVVRAFGLNAELSQMQFMYMIVVVGRMAKLWRREHGRLDIVTSEHMQIAGVMLFFKYWRGELLDADSVSSCFNHTPSYTSDDFQTMEVNFIQYYVQADTQMDLTEIIPWRVYKRTGDCRTSAPHEDVMSFLNLDAEMSSP